MLTAQAAPIRVIGAFHSDRISTSLSDYGGGFRQGWHSHDESILVLNLAGYACEQVGCQETMAPPLSVGLKPAGLRHTDDFGRDGVRALRISFSPSFLTNTENEARTIEKWGWVVGSPAVRPLLRLADTLRLTTPDEAEVMQNVYEAFAGLLAPLPDLPPDEAPSWLRDAREYLDTSYALGIRLTHLAETAGVHPIYFARQFRRFFGCSVGEYVRRLQFQATASLLADRDSSLAQIACQVGFSDQAHLTRTFVREFGVTPGQFRRLVA
jgi:AraC family transcriptional regulator